LLKNSIVQDFWFLYVFLQVRDLGSIGVIVVVLVLCFFLRDFGCINVSARRRL